MRDISRRGLLGAGLGAAAAIGVVGCGAFGSSDSGRSRATGEKGADEATRGTGPAKKDVREIGDGSTADTGKQPHQPAKPVPLEPGQTPPQFVIFSWDGAGEVGNGLFPRFLELAKDHDAAMTFFLSGLYLLPESKKSMYRPPNNPVGASDIGYLTDGHIKETLKNVRQAWLDGHEIGTHFNGHFCSGSGSVANWSSAQWHDEIDQAVSFVTEWRTNTGWTDLDPLPFDYRKELIGGRAPVCSARRICCPRRASSAGATTPARPAASRSGPRSGTGSGTCRSRRCPSPGTPSRSSRWTTTSSPTSR